MGGLLVGVLGRWRAVVEVDPGGRLVPDVSPFSLTSLISTPKPPWGVMTGGMDWHMHLGADMVGGGISGFDSSFSHRNAGGGGLLLSPPVLCVFIFFIGRSSLATSAVSSG